MNSVTILTQGSQEEKLKFLFKVYDVDGMILGRLYIKYNVLFSALTII